MATTKSNVTDEGWTDIAPATSFIQVTVGGPLYFMIETVPPSGADLSTAHILGGREGESGVQRPLTADLGLSGRVYGRTAPGTTATVVASR